MKIAPTLIMSILLLTACASDHAFREGERLMAEGRTQEGLAQMEQALREQPNNVQIRTAYLRSRETHLQRLLAQADDHLRAERLNEAASAYQAVLRPHPENARALAGLVGIETARRHRELLQGAEEALKQGELELARQKLRAVLAQAPGHARAVEMLRQVDAKVGKPQGAQAPALDPKFRRPISLEFRDAPLRSVFDAVSRQSGLNFVFDKDVRTDNRTTVYARDTAILDAVDMLLATSQLDRKVLSPNTLLIYPNLPAKQREYQDLVVKSFFLGNADVKTTLNMVKTLTRARDVFIDDKLNLMVVRDTPETVRLIEKLVAVQDRPEPEVMLEVEILEVKRSRFQELGIQYPDKLTVLNLTNQTTSSTTGGVIVSATAQATEQLTLGTLINDINAYKVGVPNPSLNLRKDASDVNLLANPRIRVKSKEKAKVHIGDKVPVITANTTSTGVVSESVAYLDVGLKLDVEPLVRLDGDVDIKVGMEVSNIVREIKSTTGTLTYQIGSRNANTVLRLKDGETQVLAGLISDEDRKGANKLPGLGDLPLLGRLFSNQRDELSKTEIVLLITPRVVRNLERPELAQAEFFAGTEAAASDQPLRVRPAASDQPQRVRPAGPGSVGSRGRSGFFRPASPPVVPAPQTESGLMEIPEPVDLPQVPPQPR